MKLQCNGYIEKIQKQCMSYAHKHYRPQQNRHDVEVEDIAQEMLQIIWQSYTNKNGVTKLIENQKLLPSWQLSLVFLNALRNLRVYDTDQPASFHPSPGRAIVDEDGEVIDYWLPETLEESDLPLTEEEKQKWLSEIKRLKKQGYSDLQIVKMLRPVAEKLKTHGSVIPEPPEQRGLF